MIVEVDSGAGFCFGVEKAIKKAEESLANGDEVYCLGEIVHNQEEINRLTRLGLNFIDHSQFDRLKGKKVLVRAHGEPPKTYKVAKKNGIEIIEATCPIVKKLQDRIKNTAIENPGFQVVIFGKETHAEVIGLAGQSPGQAIIINNLEEVSKIDFSKPIRLFSQTTKSLEDFYTLVETIKEKAEKLNTDFQYFDTICRKVSNRKDEVNAFAKQYDVIIFISGKNSSNGNYLYGIAKKANLDSWLVSSEGELKKEWFEGKSSVGISAATSTPQWLIEKVKNEIPELL